MATFYITFWTTAAGVFGLMVGSFLNALIYRLPRESLSVSRPRRSFCPVCGTTIPWHDNLPILSYLLLSGRCRFCGIKISMRYPLVEALTSALFICITLSEADRLFGYDPELFPHRLQYMGIYFLHLYIVAAALAVTFIDLDFQIIPDEITFSGAVLAPLACALMPFLQQDSFLFSAMASLNPHLASFLSSLAGAAVGGGSLLLVGFVGKAVLKREALGMGDVKLMFFFGGIFGVEGALLIFILGCAVGSVVGLPLRYITGKREIPFGPFLSLGVVLLLFFRGEIWYFIDEVWLPAVGSMAQ